MSWSDQRTLSLDAFAAAGQYAPPLRLSSYNGRPIVRSVSIINSSNADVGVCIQGLSAQPNFVCRAGQFLTTPIAPTDTVYFVFAVVKGGQQQGSVNVTVTEDQMAAASGLAPNPAYIAGPFVLDSSLLDGTDVLQ